MRNKQIGSVRVGASRFARIATAPLDARGKLPAPNLLWRTALEAKAGSRAPAHLSQSIHLTWTLALCWPSSWARASGGGTRTKQQRASFIIHRQRVASHQFLASRDYDDRREEAGEMSCELANKLAEWARPSRSDCWRSHSLVATVARRAGAEPLPAANSALLSAFFT